MVAFVTGTSSGFGAATARRFAKDGIRVVATARRIDRLKALKEEFGDLILPVTLDVRDRAQVESVVAGLPPEFASIDILVNNAGLSLNLEPAYKVPLEDWETMVDTNIKGLLYCTRLILPGMVARDRGHVVNIGSVAAMYRLSWRERLRRNESLRETVLAQPASRSVGDGGACHRYRTRAGRDRIFHCSLQR